jgi:hypothetical protein
VKLLELGRVHAVESQWLKVESGIAGKPPGKLEFTVWFFFQRSSLNCIGLA